LVVVVLLAIYRSPWLVAVPLACIALSTVVALDLLATLAQWSQNHPEAWPAWRVFTTTKIFVVVLLFGAGTDFCLFLIARFREAAARGASPDLASVDAVGRVGGAVAASALTTIVGLATMGLADFGKFAYSGPAIGASLAVALAACLTLGPALLATALGRRVAVDAAARGEVAEFGDRDEPLLGSASLARSSGVWSRIADVVVSRPGLVLTVSALVAAPLVWRGAHTEVTYDLFGELSPRATSRRGADLLMRHFPAGDVGPITVLAKLPAGSLADNEGRLKIAELAKHLHDLKGVSKVRSLYRPTGEPPGTVSVFSSRGLSAIAAAGSPVAEETFVARLPDDAGDVTRLFLVLEDSPFSERAMATCERVQDALEALAADQASPWHGAEFELLGTTPGICDLRRTTLADRRTIEISVTLSVLAVVMILLRRPIVSLLLVATVVIGYLATLGAIQLLLQWRLGTDYAGLDWKAPVFLFVILVAVGQDYNIYLVTRVFEEQRRLGGLAGLKEAMVRTGGIITSCGVIMAATFFSLTTGSLRGMVELGLALSLGILLDTFVVRTVVVPALLALLERLREPNRLAAAG
jgi:RND superfamily putative drug exporter